MKQVILDLWQKNGTQMKSNTNHDIRNETIYNTEVSESSLCDYNDAYILVRSDITITGHNIPILEEGGYFTSPPVAFPLMTQKR